MRKTLFPVVFCIFALIFLCVIKVEGVLPQVSAGNITVDGNPEDWPGTSPPEENVGVWSEGVFIWKDGENDDDGAGNLRGGYTYPNLPAFYTYPGRGGVGGEADIREFRFTYDEENLYFMLIMGSMKTKDSLAVIIAIDTDGREGSGTDWLPFYVDMTLPPSHRFELAIGYISGQLTIVKPYLDYFRGEDLGGVVAVNPSKKCIEIAVPISLLGAPYGAWHFFVAAGCGYPIDDESGFGGASSNPDGFYDFCEILETTDEQLGVWTDHPGGGLKDGEPDPWSGWEDPDIFDLCFNGTREEQKSFLSGCSVKPSKWVEISSKAILHIVFPSPKLRIRSISMNTNETIEGKTIYIYVTLEYPNGSLCKEANITSTIRNAILIFTNLMNGTYMCHLDTSGLAGYFSSRIYLATIIAECEGYEPALTYITFKVDPSPLSILTPFILITVLIIVILSVSRILASR